MWWKQNKRKVLLPLAVLVILAAAFWYGGDAPGLQGWDSGPNSAAADAGPAPAQPAQTPAPAEPDQASPAPAAQPELTPPPSPAPAPEQSPAAQPPAVPTASPAPEPIPDPTGPAPADNPLPVEPEDALITDQSYSCTLSISCATILDHMDWLDPEKKDLVPEDGWILPPVTVTFYGGESVFNVLQRTCRQQSIHLEFDMPPLYNSAYIEGIHNLYQFDCGEQSGWMYKVNDWFPNYGCSRYALQDGDVICWVYTCAYGDDVGGRNAAVE